MVDELAGLLLVHRQLRGADLEERAVRSPAGDRQADRSPGGDGDLRAGRQVPDEQGERVEACPIGDPMRVIDDQQQRRPGRDADSSSPTVARVDTAPDRMAAKTSGSSGRTRSSAAAR